MKLISLALICCGFACASLASDYEPLNIKGIAPGMPKDKVARTLGTYEPRCSMEKTLEYCPYYPVSLAGDDVTMTVAFWRGAVVHAQISDVVNTATVKYALKKKYGPPALEQGLDTAWLEKGILLRVDELKDFVSISDNEKFKMAIEEDTAAALDDI